LIQLASPSSGTPATQAALLSDETKWRTRMPDEPRRLTGRCECGRVAYCVTDAFRYALNCHCSRCRAATGAAFKPLAGIERHQFAVTDGAEALMVYGTDDLNDTRCSACGSLLYSIVRDGAYVHVAMGSLVDAPTMRPNAHIFVGSKAPWFEITDDLPQHTEYG
jgi:hypothetical protein